MKRDALTLVGDGIENPANAQIMLSAATMFGNACCFHDRCNLKDKWSRADNDDSSALPLITFEDLSEQFEPRIAFDNLNSAEEIYGFSLPTGSRPAVVVGNERRGIARSVQDIVDRAAQLPMASRRLNCLNVAAASAVALYYINRGGGGKMQTRRDPAKRRPEVLLLGPSDHFEVGSSIRSVGALGWGRVFLEDRKSVWFGTDRVTRSEGRAAARRGRNPIRVIPSTQEKKFLFDEVSVLTTKARGQALHQAQLARGSRQLLVCPDESSVDAASEDWNRFGRKVSFVHPGLPSDDFPYRYRLPVTIALAESARQIGRRARPAVRRPRRHDPFFDHALKVLMEQHGETVYVEELTEY